MRLAWNALLLLGCGSLPAFASPASIFNDADQVYRMHYATSLVMSAAVPESQYRLMAVKHNSFLIGDLAYIRESENGNAMGSPLRLDGDVKIDHVEKRADGSSEVFYSYDGEVVLNRKGMTHYRLYLPNDYESLTKLDSRELGVCSVYKTANSIPTLDLLAPYWNPFINPRHCRIPYHEIEADLKPVSLQTTYPDYPRLVKDGEIPISIFMGKMQARDPNAPVTSVFGAPMSSAVQEYRTLTKGLRRLGFVRTEVIHDRHDRSNYQEFYSLNTSRAKIRIHLVYGDSIFQGSTMDEFNALYVKAVQEDSAIFYSGHSGFLVDASGLNLYPDMQIRFDPDRYQILSLNGCQTNYYLYPIYQRKSSKNLDVFLNALETYSNVNGTLKPVEAIVAWAQKDRWTSYPELVREVDTENGMMGVVGEQDNPTAPY